MYESKVKESQEPEKHELVFTKKPPSGPDDLAVRVLEGRIPYRNSSNLAENQSVERIFDQAKALQRKYPCSWENQMLNLLKIDTPMKFRAVEPITFPEDRLAIAFAELASSRVFMRKSIEEGGREGMLLSPFTYNSASISILAQTGTDAAETCKTRAPNDVTRMKKITPVKYGVPVDYKTCQTLDVVFGRYYTSDTGR